tara:strand:+ start:989 stop:1318 length:330 start_codon:yes stop_codon:yes gene_type:complete
MLLETIVCSGMPGKEKNLLRMLKARQKFRKRDSGCLGAWVVPSSDGQPVYLVQAIYKDTGSWKLISDKIKNELDSIDGGLEGYLSGPPLVGMFDLDTDIAASEFGISLD